MTNSVANFLKLFFFFIGFAFLISFSEGSDSAAPDRQGLKSRSTRKEIQNANSTSENTDSADLPKFPITNSKGKSYTGDLLSLNRFQKFIKYLHIQGIEDLRFNMLLYNSRLHRDFLLKLFERYSQVINRQFLQFWEIMLAIPSEDVNEKMYTSLHQAVHWAFTYFAEKGHKDLASYCIFNILLCDSVEPFRETLLESVLKLPDINLNASHENVCVALFVLGVPKMPTYYPDLIISDPRLDVNCLVPATIRRYAHIACHVPELPLLWHALIYQNYHAFNILIKNRNLHVMPLIPSFFLLLRLFFIFIFFKLWDGNNVPKIDGKFKFERIIK